MGMIMTLVIVADKADADEALAAARSASREHPARILVVVLGDKRGAGQVDAQVGIGSGVSGERAVLRLSGEVTRHAESVVLPLLLPDSPVVVWWPGRAPADPVGRPAGPSRHPPDHRRGLGAHQQGAGHAHPVLQLRPRQHRPGLDPDHRLAGAARLGPGPEPGRVLSASVTAERVSPSADLLSAWLGDRLKCEVSRENSAGPGITAVVLRTKLGDISVTRTDGRLATLSSPNAPDRPVALKRRDLDELLSEELRRLDPDDVYAATVKRMARTGSRAAPKKKRRRRRRADMTDPEIETFPSPDALAAAVAGRLVVRLAAIQAAGRTPSIALTGGTVAVQIHEAVVTATEGHEDVDWSNVDIWWGDERYVPEDDPERNAKQAWDAMLSHLDVSPGRVHEMPASDGPHETVQDAAEAYGDTVRSRGGGRFDVVMLGVGPDGHVASLFPGSAVLDVDDAIAVAVTDSPKPPPERVSLTFGALNRSARGVVRGVRCRQGRCRRAGAGDRATTRRTCTTSRPPGCAARTRPCGSSTRKPPAELG